MTTAYWKFLERSQNCLRRILRKPAWDFNRFVAAPRQAKGRRWQVPTLMRALLCGFLTNRASLRAVERLTEIAEAHQGSSIGLKGNQPELFREAQRILGVQTQAERSSEWEPYQGYQLRSHRYRTSEMEASLDWSPLKQVWRVEKERHTGKTGRIEREHRDSVTNLHRGRLKPEQILAVVR